MEWLIRPRRSASDLGGPRWRDRRRSPAVDGLESRVLLSTLTVTSTADRGSGTLRDALAASHDGDSIQFAPQIQGKTIRLTAGPLVIGTSVTLGQPGTPAVTITAQGRSGDFVIDPGVLATFRSLTITGGKAIQGGGIKNLGGLDLSDCTFRGNRAARGGAIFNFNQSSGSSADSSSNGSTPTSGSLKVVNTVFVGNTAFAGPGRQASGGAIASVNGTILVSDSTFSGNGATGGSRGGSGLGGAIDAVFSVVAISGSTFSQNMASGGSRAGGGIGGAIDIQGSPSRSSAGVANQTTLSNDTFSGNRARGGQGGGNGLGGAVRVANDLSSSSDGVSISHSTFSENQAVGGSGSRGGDGAGGAIKLGSESGTDGTLLMSLDDNRYLSNQAIGGNGKLQGGDGQGGAVDLWANQPAATSSSSMARRAGIAEALSPSRVTSSNSTALGDTATGGSGGGGGEGGVFHLGFGGGSLHLEDSQFTGNSAIGGPGTPRHGAAAGGTGGAILEDSGSLSISDVTVTGNRAMGTETSFNGGHGGGLAVLNGSVIVPGSTLDEITGNLAESPDENRFEPG